MLTSRSRRWTAISPPRAAHAAAKGTLKPGGKSFTAGKLGEMNIEGTDIVLGKPFIFTKENIDDFDF